MSRINTSEHVANPSTRWFEWNGEKGCVRYYDKDAKTNVDVPLPFTFMLLDQLASVRGWHEPSKSGIYSNEVRDTTQDVLVVKSFKGGGIAEGLYKAIKLDVNAAGGSYVANCYIAYKGGDGLAIGSLRLKGAALGAWMEFTKAHRADLYKKAITIDGYSEGKKGRVIFRVPTMKVSALSPETDRIAVALDLELQAFLTAYLAKNKREQVDAVAHHVSDEEVGAERPWVDHSENVAPLTDDDIPF